MIIKKDFVLKVPREKKQVEKSTMEYKLVRRRGQKKLRMHFDKEGDLLVSAPYNVSNAVIEQFILDNKDWIEEQRGKIEEHSLNTGDRIFYFGEQYDLVVNVSSKDYLQTLPNLFVVYTRNENSLYVKEVIKIYLKKHLYEFAKERIKHWCSIMNIQEPKLEIGTATGKWGCCYKRKKLIRISLMTIALKRDLADMIVLHEVCHLFHADHSEAFWNLMKQYMPDLDKRKKELKIINDSVDFRSFYS